MELVKTTKNNLYPLNVPFMERLQSNSERKQVMLESWEVEYLRGLYWGLCYLLSLSITRLNVSHITVKYAFMQTTQIFWELKNVKDCKKLQHDINYLYSYSEKWLLSFHRDKCEWMRAGRTHTEDQRYKMEKQLKRASLEKDVGVIFDGKFRFNDRLTEKVSKANNIVRFIWKNFVSLVAEIFRIRIIYNIDKTTQLIE